MPAPPNSPSQRRVDAPTRPQPLDAGILERQPPFDLQEEIGVLGSIIILPEVCDEVAMVLRPDDF